MKQYIPKKEEEINQKNDDLLETKKTISTKTKTIAIIGTIFLIIAAFTTYAMLSPGQYDNFAKCLTEKGVVMYGEDWCQYTNAQKAMFGKSFQHVNYEVKQDLRYRPTWIIDNKKYEKVQSFQRLSALTGCKY